MSGISPFRYQSLSIALAVTLWCVVASSSVWGQTGGAVQIDHLTSGATGAGADVNTFTGEFSFSLPLLTVPGPHGSDYTISLGYQSGTSPDAGTSWVGYGWSLNPGAIVRGTKGFPDDWKGEITSWNKRRRNWTVTAALKAGVEARSIDLPNLSGEFSMGSIIRYNNNKGYSLADNYSFSVRGVGNLNYRQDDIGNHSFSAQISPTFIFGAITSGMDAAGMPIGGNDLLGQMANSALYGISSVGANAINQSLTFQSNAYQSTRFPEFKGESQTYSGGIIITLLPFFVVGPEFGTGGTYTWQQSQAKVRATAVGSLYTSTAGESNLLDYHTERDGEYRRDHSFLPIPFAGVDNFMVTGNGGGGVFRLVNRRTGIFHPNYVHSKTTIENYEPELIWGARWGAGYMTGIGSGSFKSGKWNDDINDQYIFENFADSRNAFFRFFGDPGGNILKAHTDNAVFSTHEDGAAKVPTDIFAIANEGQYAGRGSHIGFNLNQDLLKLTDHGIPYLAYNKDRSLHAFPWMKRDEEFIKEQIGEICVTGEGGSRYIYGLPVYARNEEQFQLAVGPLAQTNPASIKGKNLAYAPVTFGSAEEVQGEERPKPYASSYLLTLITSPDYVDIGFDGPSPDDLGGYVKFNYVRPAGSVLKDPSWSNEQWFHWRVPYRGLYYDRRDLSDKTDDAGGYNAGERETYYVQSIETKTHIAVFVNNTTNKIFGHHTIQGSGRYRRDAYQAPYNYTRDHDLDYRETTASDSTVSEGEWIPQSGGSYKQRENLSRYLERIELYTKDGNGDPDSLLSTVHLEYDYSLRRDMPNSITPDPDSTVREGMLTLRRVWMQNQRIYNARISPYIFSYKYKRSADFPEKIRILYPEITSFADSLGSQSLENPKYDPLGLDAWGAHQYDGADRKENGRNWIDQEPDAKEFDPAAWQLKAIKTPSQGEILVQYEQRDYAYVQDRPAHVMTSLRNGLGSSLSVDGDDNRYWINLGDLGIADTSRRDVMRYASLLRRHYQNKDERAYFKFLYALAGPTASFESPGNTTDYVNGYAVVDAITLDSVLVGSQMTYGIALRLKSEGVGSRTPDVPKKVCLEYVRTSKRGKLRDGDPIEFNDNGVDMIMALTSKFSEAEFHPENHCLVIGFTHSYIRLPAYHAKKGGGIRVKRLLTLANDSLNGSALYGAEYDYSIYDEERREYISSGVAANEPVATREENALVRPIFPAGKEELRKMIIAGPDRAQYEGPLGESLLPNPSVGYRRVVMKNIHSGKTNPGFSVAEFHTAKEFPFSYHIDGIGNSIDYTEIKSGKEEEPVLWGLTGAISFAVSKFVKWLGVGYRHEESQLDLTQGYRFILNSMHGRSKRSASYGGNYEEKDSWALSASQEYVYAEPGEKVRVQKRMGEHAAPDYIGKEMDVAIESRTIEDHTIDAGGHIDVSFPYVWPPAPDWSAAAWVGNEKNLLNMQTISKVVRYPAIIKGVLSYVDGMYHYTDHRAFDAVTGQPVISRTVDGFDKLVLEESPAGHRGAYHTYDFLAHHEYPGIGQKGVNERVVLSSSQGITIHKSTLGSGRAKLAVSSANFLSKQSALSFFNKGDLLRLSADGGSGAFAGFYHVEEVDGDEVTLVPVSPSLYSAHNSNTGSVRVEFISSGRANLPGAPVGTVVTYGELQGAPESGTSINLELSQESSWRKQFANLLNLRLGNGGGSITAAQIDSMDLKFLQSTQAGDTCAPLLDTLHLVSYSTSSTALIRLSLYDSPTACADTFTVGGGTGYFDIDEYSRLIYVPASSNLPIQLVRCLQFCPDETIRRKRMIEGVIAAGAVILNDSIHYDSTEYPGIPADANQFERGIAGRWNPMLGYTYRTAIAGGSQHNSTERSYNSGIFQDFTLFDWKNPQLNDTLSWLRSDSVVRHSAHGDPLESKDPLGLYSAVKLGYGDRLPILAAANARYEAVGFQDFENDEGSRTVEGNAHSGKWSLGMVEFGSVNSGLAFKLTEQAIEEGVLLRFWMKTTKEELPATGSGFISMAIRYPEFGDDISIGLTPDHKVAQSGEWGLYEVVVHDIPHPAGTQCEVWVTKAVDPDVAFLDDIKVQPYDAVMQCIVYDTKTFRMIAMFDDDHFGLYPQYNAEGKVVRSIVETSRGFNTVAETHGHRPSIARTSGVASQAYREDFGGASSAARRTQSLEQPSLPLDGHFDLLDVEITPDRQKVKVLGGKDRLPNLQDFSIPSGIDSLTMPESLPKDLEKLKLLKEIENIDQRLDELQKQGEEDQSENARNEAEKELDRLHRKRLELIRALGIPEEQLKRDLQILEQ